MVGGVVSWSLGLKVNGCGCVSSRKKELRDPRERMSEGTWGE